MQYFQYTIIFLCLCYAGVTLGHTAGWNLHTINCIYCMHYGCQRWQWSAGSRRTECNSVLPL